jgi:hypothetical protein
MARARHSMHGRVIVLTQCCVPRQADSSLAHPVTLASIIEDKSCRDPSASLMSLQLCCIVL